MNLIRFALAFTIVLVGQDWVLSLQKDVSPTESSSITDKIEYAARDYRMAVYKAFRTDRPEFDARRATGEKLTKEWNASGSDSQRGELLVAWFRQATTAAEKHQASPPLPGTEPENISKSPSDPAPVILRPQIPAITPPINHAHSPTHNAPQESTVIAPPKSVVVEPSVTTTQPIETAPINPFDTIKPSAPARESHAKTQEIIVPQHNTQPIEHAQPRSVAVVPYGAMPESQIPRVDQNGRETPAAMGVTVVPYGAMPESELRPATPDLNTQQSPSQENVVTAPFGASPQETPNPTPQITTDSAPSQRIELKPQPTQKFEPRDVQIFNNPLATSPAPKMNGKKSDLDTTKALLDEKRNTGVLDQPVGANLDDSELDKKMDLLQSLSKKLQLNDEQKEKLTEQLKPTDDGSKELETQLNLTELSAQIKAYQDNYRSLQAELSKPEILSTDQTESIVDTLKSLETSHKQMDLYKAIAPTEVKGALTSLGDPKSTWAMLKGQVEAQRKKLNDDLNLTNAQRQQQLRRLDAVQEIIDGRAK